MRVGGAASHPVLTAAPATTGCLLRSERGRTWGDANGIPASRHSLAPGVHGHVRGRDASSQARLRRKRRPIADSTNRGHTLRGFGRIRGTGGTLAQHEMSMKTAVGSS